MWLEEEEGWLMSLIWLSRSTDQAGPPASQERMQQGGWGGANETLTS